MAVTAEITFDDVTFISLQTNCIPIVTIARPSFSCMSKHMKRFSIV